MSGDAQGNCVVERLEGGADAGAGFGMGAGADSDALAGLAGFDGWPLAAPAPGEATWLARARPGGPVLATLRLRRSRLDAAPAAWFRLGWAVHAAAELQLHRRQRTLLLCHDLTEADELAGFGTAPGLPAPLATEAWAALLAAALDLQAQAQAPGQGQGEVTGEPPAPAQGRTAGQPAPQRPCIAQLPGQRDGLGRSPVWQGLGRHFHAQDLDSARRQHGPDWQRHVAPLLPRQLVYASLLPEAAQAALGQALPAAEPLRQALLQAGFGWRQHLGIVDGGPVLERWPPGC